MLPGEARNVVGRAASFGMGPRVYRTGRGLLRWEYGGSSHAPDDEAGLRTYAADMTRMDARQGRAVHLRSNRVGDAVLAAGLAIFMTLGTYYASHEHAARRPFDAGAVALILVAAVALAFRHRHPVVVLAAVFGTVLLYFLLGYANGPIWLALVVAFFTATVMGHRLASAVVGVAGFGLFPWVVHAFSNGESPSVVSMSAVAAWILVLYGAGEAVRFRGQRAAEARRIREEEERRRASEERLCIARDLHDVLAHNISLINVQAGAALHLNEGLPDQARASLAAIREASKEALGELRSVLDVLRRSDESPPREPTAGLADLGDLADRARGAGLEVHVDIDGRQRPLPRGVDVAVYRIAQEALTNVIRHARARTAWVRVTVAPRDITLRVEDDGPDPMVPEAHGRGTGIAGMRERAGSLGGELDAGPRPEGGFRVLARIPLEVRT
jgi:signal transduction histidine kinase